MFELSVARKYLLPRWRQLSVSIISLLSALVISLVVCLIVVFFSVTTGLERVWTEKLIALTAPVRVHPTPAYTESYYFNIDSFSVESDYTLKGIGDKRIALETDPWDPEMDPELPQTLPSPEGKDLVKLVFAAIESIDGVAGVEYDIAVANLQVRTANGATLSQNSFISSFDGKNPLLERALKGEHRLQRAGDQWELSDQAGYGVLLARHFQENGVELGDRGGLTYQTTGLSGAHEQRIPITVEGFYDPGVIPVGGKFVLVSPDVTRVVRAAYNQQDDITTTGINVWFSDYARADQIKAELQQKFVEAGISDYWRVDTYREYDFTRGVMDQLQSDKLIFGLLAVLIILVACSNIVTLLLLLVHDKRLEIGILRSMGATTRSVVMIFGLCGLTMGAAGGVLGAIGAILILRYLPQILGVLSWLQGHDVMSPVFFGDTVPNTLNVQVLLLVMFATAVASVIAGVIPAVKASLVKPAAVLRSE